MSTNTNLNDENNKKIKINIQKENPPSNNITSTPELLKSDNLNKETVAKIPPNIDLGNLIEKSQLGRFSSTVSIGFPEVSSDRPPTPPPIQTNDQNVLTSLPDKSDSHKILSDVFCLCAICTEHKRIVVQMMPNKCYFLPFVQLEEDMAFAKLFKDFLKLIIVNPHGKASLPEIADIWRVQQPKSNQYLTRYIFKTLLYPADNIKNNSKKCCVNNDKFTWLNIEELKTSLKTDNHKLWGNEPLKLLESMDSAANSIREFSSIDIANSFNNYKEELLFKLVGHDKNDIHIIFNEFLVQCYPSESMTFASFCLFCSKLSFKNHFSTEKLLMLFNSFDINRKYALSFKELILGFSFMDDNLTTLSPIQTVNETVLLLDMRYEYLFRYYDSNSNDFLEKNELLILLNNYIEEIGLIDVKQSPSFQTVQNRMSFIDNLIQNFGSKHAKTDQPGLSFSQARVAFNDCINQINQTNTKGTKLPELATVLFRIPFDVISFAGNKFCYKRYVKKSMYTDFCIHLDYNRPCQQCRKIKYLYSHHMICLSKMGDISDIVRLEPLNTSHMSFDVDIPETDIFIMANDLLNRIQRFAMALFNKQMMEEEIPETDQAQMVTNWFFPNQASKFESIRLICQTVQGIFAKEKRILEINSPCYVLGDIHGNLKDLAHFSQQLWRFSPFINKANYLFLGDYVDRGQWGIEVIILLFSFKILAPNNFFLIRGNHEIREVQEQFTFFAECRSRLSIELWELINDCFDRMPIAALIDQALYCCHGGIPSSITTIEQLNTIPCPIEYPLYQSPETWEILWNDPIDLEEWKLLPDCRKSSPFARNVKRGTGYMYGEEAVNKFFKRNSIDFILRGHEVFQDGFFFHVRGQVLTVFSSSRYSYMNNTAAVLMVTQGRVRIIRFENTD